MDKAINELQSQLEILTKTIRNLNKGNYIMLDIFGNSGIVEPNTSMQFEILAARCGTFKPTKIRVYGMTKPKMKPEMVATCNTPVDVSVMQPSIPADFEIESVNIMGIPQLVNYDGTTVSRNRGHSKFWSEETEIDWSCFGSCAGQGLQFIVSNLHQTDPAILYVHLRGYIVDSELLGKK